MQKLQENLSGIITLQLSVDSKHFQCNDLSMFSSVLHVFTKSLRAAVHVSSAPVETRVQLWDDTQRQQR